MEEGDLEIGYVGGDEGGGRVGGGEELVVVADAAEASWMIKSGEIGWIFPVSVKTLKMLVKFNKFSWTSLS